MTDNRKIAVVGVGQVGAVLAAHLIQAGRDVTLIDAFSEHLARMRADGLVVNGFKQITVPVTRTYLGTDEAIRADERFDVVWICLKAGVTKRIVGSLPALLAEDGVVVCFQNGLDTEAPVLEIIGPERTLRGVVNFAGNLLAPGRIKMTFFNPPNYVGAAVPGNAAAEESARGAAALMDGSGLTCEYSEDVRRHVWEKVIRNAALMPISALTGMDMAQVMESPRSLYVLEKTLSEAINVASKVGFHFDQKFYLDTLTYYLKAGHHMPSMWGDIQESRTTEIEVLNNKIAEYGERYGIEVPYNRSLANLVICIDELTALKKKG